MRRHIALAAAGVAAILIGAVAPWAGAQTGRGQVTVDGFDRGGDVLLILGVIALVAVAAGWRRLALLVAIGAVGYAALALYSLPGVLIDELPAGEASLMWGAGLSLAGALALFASPWLSPEEPVRRPEPAR